MEKLSNIKTYQLKNNFNIKIFRLPWLTEFVTSITIPSVTIGRAPFQNPFTTLNYASKPTFSDLQINFIMSEGGSNYWDIYNWMISLSNAKKLGGIKNWNSENKDLVDNCILTINDSNNIPKMTIRYNDIWPVSITEFEMTTVETGNITVNTVWNYSTYDIENV